MKLSFSGICRPVRVNLFLWILAGLFSACQPGFRTTPDPLVGTIAAMQTERVVLKAVLSETPAPTFTPTPLLQPTSTTEIRPSPTPNLENLGTTQAVYYLAPDINLIDQVWRLEPDGFGVSQITRETSSLTDFDISSRGDLAYVVRDTPQSSPRLMLLTANDENPTAIAELDAEGETIQYVKWLPDGNSLVFNRTLVVSDTASTESPIIASELVQYKLADSEIQVLLRAGPDPIDPVLGTLFTDESLEYDATHDWQVVYQVTASTPDGNFLLINDSGGPFWSIYDLRQNTVFHFKIRAVSADFDPNGLNLCLTGVTGDPDFPANQALLCADELANSIHVFLNAPSWHPFSLDYWPAENAAVFLQTSGQGESSRLQIYGVDLDGSDPLLLRQETFIFLDELIDPRSVLYAPYENQAEGMVVLTGKTPTMKTSGLVFMPFDSNVPIQTIELGLARQPRWGPAILP